MVNIVLVCAAGSSTSLLVSKIKEEAEKQNYEITIAAHAFRDLYGKADDADIILLGPQIRYNLSKVQKLYPEKPVYVIDMVLYGRMDGKGVLKMVQDKLN